MRWWLSIICRSFLNIFGGILGGILGLLVWLAITIVISHIISYFYPGSTSDIMGHWPSDESFLVLCVLSPFLPSAAFLGSSLGVIGGERIYSRLNR
jgi:hypothetical protein